MKLNKTVHILIGREKFYVFAFIHVL